MTPSDTLAGRPRRFPTAKADSVLAGILLSFLATAGLFYVNIMAAIVDGLVSGLGLTDAQAGNIGSANIYGAALGALIAIILIKRIKWRPAAIAALIGLIAIDILSIFITDASVLIYVRLFHGIIGGLLVGISYGVIARTANPDRTFGVLLFVQFGLGGLGVMLLPRLVPIYGPQALFIALILFSLASLAMVPFLDRYPPRPKLSGALAGTIQKKPLTYTLLAIFLFQAVNMALLAYIIRLGITYGLERDYVSTALGLATWVALLGPGLVIVIGTRYGRFWPLFLVMGLTLAGTALFHFSGNKAAYLIANCGTGITWGMVMAYLLGMASQFDASGRTAAAGGFVSKIGLATGPVVAGQVLTAGYGFDVILNGALILFVVSTVIMLIPARQLDRQSRILLDDTL
ncbi:hypothetical protein GCM10009069_21160 [Algimonas arctica]|uniref:Major facilitator superfamily (MFS) profile domain-containing protein n=1 Tax=Algimonas arctica TaxID=1479486 RepID=A0A8J3CS56_9PROT|nr:MFS transporter [Algimonas arctica]GHA97919.1 hypothetical protein GCM10009069_21160 [Algimonas arctica]